MAVHSNTEGPIHHSKVTAANRATVAADIRLSKEGILLSRADILPSKASTAGHHHSKVDIHLSKADTERRRRRDIKHDGRHGCGSSGRLGVVREPSN